MTGSRNLGEPENTDASVLRFPMSLFKAATLVRTPTHVLRDTFQGLLWRSVDSEGEYQVEELELLLTIEVVVRILRTTGVDLRDGRAYGLPDAFASRELLDRIREAWKARTGIPTVQGGLAITAGRMPLNAGPLPPRALVMINLDEIVADLTTRAGMFENRAYASLVDGGVRGHLEAILLMAREVREVLAGLPMDVDAELGDRDLAERVMPALLGRVDRGISDITDALRWLALLEAEHVDILEPDG
jgi:hypothetical protein